MPTNIELRETVRDRYAEAARSVDDGCCAPAYETNTSNFGRDLYPAKDIVNVPAGASDASLGCGNPTAVVDLAEGRPFWTSGPALASTFSCQPSGSGRPASHTEST